jgi:hypothetical protein
VVKAVGFSEFGGAEVMRVLELPEPHAGPGQVRIKVAAAVHPSDVNTRLGLAAQNMPDRYPPAEEYVVGWDAAGVIDEVGEGVRAELAVGAEVMLPLRLLAKGEATPGAIVSVSPWTDLTLQNPAVDANETNDKMLSRGTLELFRGAWLQDPAVDFTSPEISLVNADLTGLPPTLVYYGEYETLADDGAQLGRRLADFKVTTETHAMPEGQHSFVLGAGRVPEVDQAIGQMGQWLRKHLGA